jgi:predicted amidohydrolase
MKITVSQQPVFASIKENLECILDVLNTHKDSDWILTPEGSLSGYCANVCHEGTEEQKGEYFEALSVLEKYLQENKRSIALGTGHYEQDGFPYNQIRYYYQGQLVSAYNKQLLTRTHTGLGENYYYLPGLHSMITQLSESGPTVGSLICNDAWAFPSASPKGNPYLWNDYRDADFVFVSANCNTEEFDPVIYNYHESHLQMFAKLNSQIVFVANACTDMVGGVIEHRVQAPSGIIDPNGEWIAKCNDTGMDTVSMEIQTRHDDN